MEELRVQEVKGLAEAAGVKVPEIELQLLTVRLNGMLGLLEQLNSLPLDKIEIIPTLLTQRKD